MSQFSSKDVGGVDENQRIEIAGVKHDEPNQKKFTELKKHVKSLAIINTRAVVGVQALPVSVEVHLANGLPSFSTVGLPEITVKESKDRVRAAIINSGFEFPAKRITVNLAPADLPKTGGRFDLPIAIGILVASGQLKVSDLERYELVGELALDGRLRSVAGVLPTSMFCHKSGRNLILPSENAEEASLTGDGLCFHANHLLDVCRHFCDVQPMALCDAKPDIDIEQNDYPDLADVKGQQFAKRALEIAASGGHSLLFIGPPGTGKSMLASRLPGIMPELELKAALEVASIESVAKGRFDISKWRSRPFRSPHHSASAVALVGGGSYPKPGEISRAHKGVLFLDELTEFSRAAIEQLREPLESGRVNIVRANQSVQYPAEFMLIAACNPCRCGFYGDDTNRCNCSPGSLAAYQSKLSGPMMDRVDMHVKLSRVSVKVLQSSNGTGDTSNVIKARVIDAQKYQYQRQGKLNAQLFNFEIERVCKLDEPLLIFLQKACDKLNMSARAYHRVLKLARTVADMEAEKEIQQPHLLEALNLRSLDRLR